MIRLAVSIGDPAGIGPEVVLKAFGDPRLRRLREVDVIIVGDDALIHEAAGRIGVPAPPNKEALGLAGEPFPGHTELLAAEFAAPRTRMMLAGGALRVVLVTTHMSLAEVPRALSIEGIRDTIVTAHEALVEDFRIPA